MLCSSEEVVSKQPTGESGVKQPNQSKPKMPTSQLAHGAAELGWFHYPQGEICNIMDKNKHPLFLRRWEVLSVRKSVALYHCALSHLPSVSLPDLITLMSPHISNCLCPFPSGI